MDFAKTHPCHRMLSGLLLGMSLVPALSAPDFVHEVAPILDKHCSKCHMDKMKGGLSMNTEESFREGSEDGPIVESAHPEKSLLLERITTDDEDERMPPKGKGLNSAEVEVVRAWLQDGAKWEPGFAFKKPAYDPPLRPRNPTLPAVVDGRANPIDRIIDHYLAEKNQPRPEPLDDSTFLRRVHLDLTGLLPDADEVTAFLANKSAGKREELVDRLLADKTAYTEHWLTFWNDLLRNDYVGTGYIDGGRKQISGWLYQALHDNMPYDQFVRALVAPSPDNEGFANGIKWRGTVSAAQTTPLQFAQSVGQSFLGINLKCASCHDSFVDRWKLSEAYGLAAIFSDEPMELYRCDKPTGKMAKPAWLFPELGTVDASQPKAERLKQLAALITAPENGRTQRAITNRLWQRLMGRGIVHPVDAMQSPPWNDDLLDYLGFNLRENHYDLKQTLRLICLSQAYQSKTETFGKAPQESSYVFNGPYAKRMTAEEFTDAIWQICGTAPAKFDAPVKREASGVTPTMLNRKPVWIWSDTNPAQAGAKLSLRKRFKLTKVPEAAFAVVGVDNQFELYVNGQKAGEGADWQQPSSIMLRQHLVAGDNEFLLVATNLGSEPNLAGALFHALLKQDGKWAELVSDGGWEVSPTLPDSNGNFKTPPTDWKEATVIASNPWAEATNAVGSQLDAMSAPQVMVRAALLKSDLLMRTLGRPNREQIVSTRPDDLTTLEAMDLNNGAILDQRLAEGAQALLKKFPSSAALASYVWRSALSREPSSDELQLAMSLLGPKPDITATQDFLWGIFMLPEFQIIR